MAIRQRRATPVGVLEDPGQRAQNQLLIAGNAVAADIFTIDGVTFEVEIVNTDSTNDAAGGDFNNVTNPLTVVGAVLTYPLVVFAVGKLIRIENEILRVTAVDGNDVTLTRGVSGTVAAAHANGQSIFQGNGIAGGSDIAVGLVTTLTPTALATALAADINAAGIDFLALRSGPELAIAARASGTGFNGVACSTTNGAGSAWASATTYGGTDPARNFLAPQIRDATAAEDAEAKMAFVFSGPVKLILITVNGVLFDGTVTYSTPADAAFLDFDGAVTLTAGDEVIVLGVGE